MHEYQKEAWKFVVDRLFIQDELGAGLFLDPGLGKTLISLEAIKLLREIKTKPRVLVIAPLRPCYGVWPREVIKWDLPFRVAIVHGTIRQRFSALQSDADIFVTNFESVKWLANTLLRHPGYPNFDLTIFDEITGFKNWSSARGKWIRRVLHKLGKRIGLTGTPAPNCHTELYPQIYLLDDGKSLGKNVTRFRELYCKRAGFRDHSWAVQEGKETRIEAAIAPLVLRMDCRDYLDMPQLVRNKIMVSLPPNILRGYRQLERELFMLLDSGQTLTAGSASAKYSAICSVASGGMYERTEESNERISHYVHGKKTEALAELQEELAGKPLLVAYSFQHDRDRLAKAFPRMPFIGRGTTPREANEIIAKWNARKLPLLAVHPQALSYGENMQFGGSDLVWYTLTDHPEKHTQLNARLWRQGQKDQVRIHYLLAENTIDIAKYIRIQSKDNRQEALLNAIQEYRRGGGIS